MEEYIKISYNKDKGEEYYAEKYKSKGYRIHEIQNLIEGDFLVFGPLTEYHSIKNNEWTFDKDRWIEEVVRPERDKRLKDSDYLMIHDVKEKLNDNELNEWRVYRQELRDFTNNIEYSESLNWPKKPF